MVDSKTPLLDSGVALAAITAALYCFGSAKYGGYLSALQLDADVLDRNFQQVLYQGFLASFANIFLGLFGYTISHFFYSHAVLPGIRDWLQKSIKSKRKYLRVKRNLLGKRKDSPFVLRAKRQTIAFAILTASSLVLILTLVYFESEGRRAAEIVLRKLDAPSFQDSDLISVQLGDEHLKLVYLTCGARNCAGIDPSTRTVHYFPQNGHSYHLPIKKETQSKSNDAKTQ